MSDPTPLLSLRGVHRHFRRDGVDTHVLKGIDLDIHAGEFVAIIGASGSGKSTLMNILGLLDRPTEGRQDFAGRDVARLSRDDLARLRRQSIGFVFQHYHLIPRMSAIGNVELPAIYAGLPRDQRRTRAAALLRRLGLVDRLENRPSQLSGGQQQRVSIARALMNGGAVILADEPTGALDRRSGQEVMALLGDLAAAGHTVILITHDPAVAAAADRIIEIADGRIVGERRAATAGEPASRPPPALPPPPPAQTPDVAATAAVEAVRSAFSALAANPFRTALTLLGIIIGVASVVAMMAIGRGTQVTMTEQAAAIGTDWVVVGRIGDSRITSNPLTAADADALRDLPQVSAAMPGLWEMVTLRHGNRDVRAEVIGTNHEFRRVHHWETARGSFFTAEDEAAGTPVLLLGATVAAALFPDTPDPSGTRILVNSVPFLVTGVLERKGPADDGSDRDNMVVMPLKTASTRLFGTTDLDIVVLSIADMTQLEATKEVIRHTLIHRHGREDFWMQDAAGAFLKAEESRRSMNRLLAAIAALSLLVGGIGVMNIMLMTVQERTREIGIRTATGARTTDIQRQFLIEAVVLSAVGGGVGLVLGGAIAATAAHVGGMTVVFSATAVAASFAAAVIVGITFGFMPARRAARLDPVTALGGD